MWDRIYASHPDHLAAGEAAICAVYPDSRNPFAHPELLEEGFEPHTVPEIWLVAYGAPNAAVDVTKNFDRKVEALRCHKSQVGEGAELPKMLRSWLEPQGKLAGLAPGGLAESFRIVPAS
jgi:LmbE family N-acetylglucosaminyl deacetylase